jgi:hypothetical protein
MKLTAILLTAALLLALTACQGGESDSDSGNDGSASAGASAPDSPTSEPPRDVHEPQMRFEDTRLYAVTDFTRIGEPFAVSRVFDDSADVTIFRVNDTHIIADGELLRLTLGNVFWFRDDDGGYRFVDPDWDDLDPDSDMAAMMFSADRFAFLESGTDEFEGRELFYEDFADGNSFVVRHFFDGDTLVGARFIGYTEDSPILPEDRVYDSVGLQWQLTVSSEIPDGAFEPPAGAVEMSMDEYMEILMSGMSGG